MRPYTRLRFIKGIIDLKVFGVPDIAYETRIVAPTELSEELEAMVSQGLLTKMASPSFEFDLPEELYVTSNPEAVKAWEIELLKMPEIEPSVEEARAHILRQSIVYIGLQRENWLVALAYRVPL